MRNRVATRGGDDNRNRPHILRSLRPALMPKASKINCNTFPSPLLLDFLECEEVKNEVATEVLSLGFLSCERQLPGRCAPVYTGVAGCGALWYIADIRRKPQ